MSPPEHSQTCGQPHGEVCGQVAGHEKAIDTFGKEQTIERWF